jgi:hypothetical protein
MYSFARLAISREYKPASYIASCDDIGPVCVSTGGSCSCGARVGRSLCCTVGFGRSLVRGVVKIGEVGR